MLLGGLAGCTEAQDALTRGPAVDPCAGDAGPLVAQRDVENPYELAVRVRAENATGPALSGVEVSFWAFTAPTQTSACEPAVAGDTEPRFLQVAAGRTNREGIVLGRLQPDVPVAVAVNGPEGYHGETLQGLGPGAAGTRRDVTVPLLKDSLAFVLTNSMTRFYSVGKVPILQPTYDNTPMRMHPDHEVHGTYLERLESLVLVLEWSNSMLNHADLYPGLALDDEAPFHAADDEAQPPLDGTYQETLTVGREVLGPVRDAYLGDRVLMASAVTTKPMDNLDGSPYTFYVTARFSYAAPPVA